MEGDARLEEIEEIGIELKLGMVLLKKPLAGTRNKALIKAETAEGIKSMVFMVELLPNCIKTHPFGAVPIRDALDNLSIEDYDKLIDGLQKIIQPKGDVEKKSVKPLELSPQEKDSK